MSCVVDCNREAEDTSAIVVRFSYSANHFPDFGDQQTIGCSVLPAAVSSTYKTLSLQLA